MKLRIYIPQELIIRAAFLMLEILFLIGIIVNFKLWREGKWYLKTTKTENTTITSPF